MEVHMFSYVRLARLFVAIAATALSLLLPSAVFALYPGKDNAGVATNQVSKLIIKFRNHPEANTDLTKDPSRTGYPAVDALNIKYAVKAQSPLLPQEALRSSDNPLKAVYLLEIDAGTDVEEMAEEYSKLAEVEYAEPDYSVELHAVPDDPWYTQQWALNNTGQGHYHVDRFPGSNNDVLITVSGTPDADIDAEEVFVNKPDNTATVVVAIVDTGIDWDHPDLASVVWHNPNEISDNGIDDDHNGYVDDIVGWDFSGNAAGLPVTQDNDPTDTFGHGTHCAGIVAAAINNAVGVAGVVPDAQIMGLDFYPGLSFSNGALAIVYAADNGADIISMSWGGIFASTIIQEALDYATSRGLVLVASAGNDGKERVNYPASYPNVISVGATTSLDHVATFSTYNDFLALSGPGQAILSLRADSTDMYTKYGEPNVHIIDNLYYLADGTSMAGPYVAAVAAYMRSISPGLSPNKTRQILQTTADDLVDPYGTGDNLVGWDRYSGSGRVNLLAALGQTPAVRAEISAPGNFDLVSGNLPISGSADGGDFDYYILEYSSGTQAALWTRIDSSGAPVSDNLLGSLDCSVLADGDYIIRLRVGNDNMDDVHIWVSSGAIAQITSPQTDEFLSGGIVAIQGSAFCPGFDHSTLEYGEGSSPSTWNFVAQKSAPVHGSNIGYWNLGSLPDGIYTIRLQVYSNIGLEATDQLTVQILSPFLPDRGWSLYLDDVLSRAPNYLDLDNDGQLEIVIGSRTTIFVVNPDGTLKTDGIPAFATDDYSLVPIAVGRLDPDGQDDFVAVGASGTMYIHRSDLSAPILANLEVPPEWRHLVVGAAFNAPRVFLQDINNDGIDEIHYFAGINVTRNKHCFIYGADGSLRNWCGGASNPGSSYQRCLPADLDGDGIYEIYCYGADLRQYDTSGCTVNFVNIEQDGLELFPSTVNLSAVDIDRDGTAELIVYGGFVVNPYLTLNSMVYAYDNGLQLVAGFPHNTGINVIDNMSEPVFGDLDGDGNLEYVTTHLQSFRAWHLDGSSFLGDELTNGLLASSDNPGFGNVPLLCDVTGDGIADVLGNTGIDPFGSYDVERFEAFMSNGERIAGFPMVTVPSAGLTGHVPMIGDFNQDGILDIVSPTSAKTLVFHQFDGVSVNQGSKFAPMWLYNRRMNATLIPSSAGPCCLLRGDVDHNGTVDITDLTSFVDYLFGGGSALICEEEADLDGNGLVDITDLTQLVDYLFGSGPEPVSCL